MTRVAKIPSWRLLLACAVLFSTTAGNEHVDISYQITEQCKEFECAKYKVLEFTKEYELREYERCLFPEVEVKRPINAEEMHGKLERYMRGANVDKKSYPDNSFPVIYSPVALTSYYPHDRYPEPTEKGVKLVWYPVMRIFVRAFSTRYPFDELMKAVDDDRIDPNYMYYNELKSSDSHNTTARELGIVAIY